MTNVVENFLKYVSFHTTSDEKSETVPSTQRQKLLGEYIASQLKEIGMEAETDEKGYVYGFLEASEGMEKEKPIGFISHLDTSPDVSGKDIKPRIIEYDGGDIALSDSVIMKAEEFELLGKYKGKHLIVTDGTTLLGADDKAGIAEIVTACEHLINNPEIKHRAVSVCFTPDEEIGRGADYFDFDKFHSGEAYTLDGGELGEIEYENFNAASAKITFHGVNIHPGSAKNKMKNAALMVSEYISMLPQSEAPAHTENYEGFYHINHIESDESLGVIEMIIRDHNRDKFEKRKEFIRNLTAYFNSVHGENTAELWLKDTYYNMKEKILPHFHLIENAEKAMKNSGVEPVIVPIRGGTDGARLSYMGLPCPNLSTGGANFHGIYEFVCTESMEKMVSVVVELCK